tara:strand:- start:74 stop:460 length:387 start_codon:yes stop_codon:yes gene_type:complete
MEQQIKVSSNKSFGIVFFIVFLIIALYPMIKDGDIRLWSLILSLIFLILGLINSIILTPLNRLWFKFGIFLGKIVSPIILGIIFFLVVTPTGLLLRLFGKDVINLKYNNNNSYWIKKTGPKSKMKDQF